MDRPIRSFVQINRDVLDAVTAHARAEAPNECCGLLVGTEERIDESVPTRNIATSATRYQVDPHEHIALNRSLRESQRAIVGAYHSHPQTAALPSPTDIAEAYYPEFVYVIVSIADPAVPEIRAYRIAGGNVDPVRIVPVP
jgi:proteasome lid subunit RPN8/RPN11